MELLLPYVTGEDRWAVDPGREMLEWGHMDVARALAHGIEDCRGSMAYWAMVEVKPAFLDIAQEAGEDLDGVLHGAMEKERLPALRHALTKVDRVRGLNGEWRESAERAARGDEVEALELVLAKGLDPDLRGEKGTTLLEEAREAGATRVVALLEGAGATAGPDRTQETIDRWRAWLAEHRRTWPEWEELEARAASETFQLSTGANADTLTGETLIVDVPRTPTSRWPWLDALLNVRRVADDRGLANALSWGQVTKSGSGDVLPSGLHWPRGRLDAWEFAITGTLLVVDEGDNVLAPSAGGFATIGRAEDLARYCLRAALDGRNWYFDYSAGKDLDAYGLQAVGFHGE